MSGYNFYTVWCIWRAAQHTGRKSAPCLEINCFKPRLWTSYASVCLQCFMEIQAQCSVVHACADWKTLVIVMQVQLERIIDKPRRIAKSQKSVHPSQKSTKSVLKIKGRNMNKHWKKNKKKQNTDPSVGHQCCWMRLNAPLPATKRYHILALNNKYVLVCFNKYNRLINTSLYA